MTLRLLVLKTLRWLVAREVFGVGDEAPADEGKALLKELDEQIVTEEIEEKLLGGLGQPMPVWSPPEPEQPPVVEGQLKEKEQESDA